MSQKLPFRTYLRPSTAQTDAELESRVDALLKLTERYGPSREEMLELVQHPDEDIALLLWRMSRVGRGPSLPNEAIKALCDRAVADARAEGFVWTPLIDEFASTTAFQRAVELDEKKKEDWGVADNDSNKDLGIDYRLASHLAPWIRQQDDPAALHPLLRFQAPALWRVLGREMRVIDDVLLERFESLPDLVIVALTQNPNFRDLLSRRWWSAYRSSRGREGSERKNRALECLAILAEQGTGLSSDVRAEIISHLRRCKNIDRNLVKVVVRDRELTAEDIKRLVRLLNDYEAVEVLVSGRAHETEVIELLRRRAVAARISAQKIVAAKNKSVAKKLLARIFECHPNDKEIAINLAENPNTPLDTLRAMAESSSSWIRSYVLDVIAARPKCRRDPAIRKVLMKSESGIVAKHMIPEANSEEYPILLERIVRNSKETAIHCLEQTPPPAGTQIPTSIWQALLSARSRGVRLRAIALFGQYGNDLTPSKIANEFRDRPRRTTI